MPGGINRCSMYEFIYLIFSSPVFCFTLLPGYLSVSISSLITRDGTGPDSFEFFSPVVTGVDTQATGGTFDISNSDRLGFSEVQLVQQVIDGIDNLIEMEKALEKNKNIDDMVNKIINKQ